MNEKITKPTENWSYWGSKPQSKNNMWYYTILVARKTHNKSFTQEYILCFRNVFPIFSCAWYDFHSLEHTLSKALHWLMIRRRLYNGSCPNLLNIDKVMIIFLFNCYSGIIIQVILWVLSNLVKNRFKNISWGISQPVVYGDPTNCLQTKEVKCEANFVSSGSKIVKCLRHHKYDPWPSDHREDYRSCP